MGVLRAQPQLRLARSVRFLACEMGTRPAPTSRGGAQLCPNFVSVGDRPAGDTGQAPPSNPPGRSRARLRSPTPRVSSGPRVPSAVRARAPPASHLALLGAAAPSAPGRANAALRCSQGGGGGWNVEPALGEQLDLRRVTWRLPPELIPRLSASSGRSSDAAEGGADGEGGPRPAGGDGAVRPRPTPHTLSP